MDQDHFSEALAALRKGETIDSITARFPTESDELRSMLELSQELRTAPAPALPARWKVAEAQFLQAAAERRVAKTQPRRRRWSLPSLLSLRIGRRLAVAAAVLLLFVMMSTGTVMASAAALPGSPLYSIKRSVEAVQLLVSSEESRPALLLSQAKERQREIAALLAQDHDVPPSLIADLSTGVENSIELLYEQETQPAELWENLEQLSELSIAVIDQAAQQGALDPASLEQAKHSLQNSRAKAKAKGLDQRDAGPASEHGRPTPAASPTTGRQPDTTRAPQHHVGTPADHPRPDKSQKATGRPTELPGNRRDKTDDPAVQKGDKKPSPANADPGGERQKPPAEPKGKGKPPKGKGNGKGKGGGGGAKPPPPPPPKPAPGPPPGKGKGK